LLKNYAATVCLKIKNPTKMILLWQIPNVLP